MRNNALIWLYRGLGLALLCCANVPIAAAADLDFSKSEISAGWFSGAAVTLHLDQAVPFSIWLQDNPMELYVQMQGTGSRTSSIETLRVSGHVLSAPRFDVVGDGAGVFMAKLDRPMVPDNVEINQIAPDGGYELKISLSSAQADEFTKWVPARRTQPAAPAKTGFTVVLDPGHGGSDPGAEHGALVEKDLMLGFAQRLRAVLLHAGVGDVVLTRGDDRFVSLTERLGTASASGADLFLSLHADATPDGAASGATVYVFAPVASDTQTAALAARLSLKAGGPDDLSRVLDDFARSATLPLARDLAQNLVQDMGRADVPLNPAPLREADFMVLRAGHIPSVLLELGFINSQKDLKNIQDEAWQDKMAGAIAQAILRWQADHHLPDIARR